MATHVFDAAAGEGIPAGVKPTFISVDKTHDWKHSTIVAAVKHEGRIYTDVVRTTSDTDLDRLEAECLELRGGVTFVVGPNNKDLAARLDKRGIPVETLVGGRMMDAAATAYAQIARGNVTHDGASLIRNQLPFVVRKNVGSGYKIVPGAGSNIEGVYAFVMAVYAAETIKPKGAMVL